MSENPALDLITLDDRLVSVDQIPLWERQPAEDPAEFYAFHNFYLAQHPPRTLTEAYRRYRVELQRSTDHFNISQRFKDMFHGLRGAAPWPERGAAWDEYCAQVDRARILEHRADLIDREWQIVSAGLDKLQQMLQAPVFETVSEDGTVVIKPARWNWGDVGRLAEALSKIGRLNTEQPTERIASTGAVTAIREIVVVKQTDADHG